MLISRQNSNGASFITQYHLIFCFASRKSFLIPNLLRKPSSFQHVALKIILHLTEKNMNVRMQVSREVNDQDYLPDNESSGDESEGASVKNEDEKLKRGNTELSRNLDNECVFDKDWAFRRKCSLQSLLSAKLLNLTYETKSLELPIKSQQHKDGSLNKNHSSNTEKNCEPSSTHKSKKLLIHGARRREKSEVSL